MSSDPRPASFVTVKEIAPILRVSKMTVYRLIHDGDLRAVRVGRQIRVRMDDLGRYMQSIDKRGAA